jgi:hypothetical protein
MIRKKGLGFRVLWVLGQTKTRFVGRGPWAVDRLKVGR